VKYKKETKAMNTTIQNATRSGVFDRTQKLIGALTVGALFVIPVLSPGAAKAVLVSALPNMSLLTPYATFGNFFNDQNVTVKGNAGISNFGHLSLEAPSQITGRLDLGIGATTSGGGYPGQVLGPITTGIDFTSAQNQVFSASSTLAGFAADTTLTSLSSGLSISGNGAVKVVNITGNVDLVSGENITFSGGANEYLVLNIFGDLDMGGNAMIGTLGQASHILVNLVTTGSLGNVTHVNNFINGTTLIPFATYAEFHSVNGAIYGGFGGDGQYGLQGSAGNAGMIKLMSDSTVNYTPYVPPPPPPAVPEPTTFIAGALLLLPFGASTLRILRRKATA
jgi:hypothetical protein